MNKKVILFSLTLLVILSVTLFYIKNKGERPPNQINSTIIPIITGTNLGKVNFEFELPQNLSLPKKTALLTINNMSKWSEENVKNIAKFLAFTKDPIIANDINLGKTYLYSENNSSLTVYSDEKILRYSRNVQERPEEKIQEDKYINISETFVNSIPLTNIYKFAFINYINTDQATDTYSEATKDTANTIRVNLSPISKDYKIITSPDLSLATVTMDIGGNILKVLIQDIDKVSVSETEYLLKTIDEIKNSTNQYILMSVNGKFYSDPELIKNNVLKVNINSIELAYYYDNKQKNIIQPIFLISGNALLKSSGEEDVVVFYLPAFAE